MLELPDRLAPKLTAILSEMLDVIRVAKNLVSKLMRSIQDPTGFNYWERRAAQYGRRAVLNIGHPDEEFDQVTEKQKSEILPYLQQLLNGGENVILDFGCGPGRFTGDLAALIAGKAIGIDPISRLLDLAPRSGQVEYLPMEESRIPLPRESVDIVWVCLVLGGIVRRQQLARVVGEINRVLRSKGLLFLVENTSEKSNGSYWVFRSASDYVRMFPSFRLVHLHDYFDLGERISIIAGRKFS